MEINIKEAIELLRKNGYFVKKIPDDKELSECESNCLETGYGVCDTCNSFICLCGANY